MKQYLEDENLNQFCNWLAEEMAELIAYERFFYVPPGTPEGFLHLIPDRPKTEFPCLKCYLRDHP